jgi:hypothetical protein
MYAPFTHTFRYKELSDVNQHGSISFHAATLLTLAAVSLSGLAALAPRL